MAVEVEEEVERRKQLQADAATRHKTILQHYVPRNPFVYNLQAYFMHPTMVDLLRRLRADDVTADQLTAGMQQLPQRVFAFPVFTKDFCRQLLEELKHFEESDMPKGRPNTMNKHGILLDELGMNPEFFDVLREKYLLPITSLLYPDVGGNCLDSHKVFVVTYKPGEDEDLACHFDNAEVTINISLNEDYEGGELYFGHMVEEPPTESRSVYKHQIGAGVLHRGQQLHGAMPIEEGERYNLIIWMRSSSVRNERCPMCRNKPNIMPVSYGTGDGFIQYTEELCTTS